MLLISHSTMTNPRGPVPMVRRSGGAQWWSAVVDVPRPGLDPTSGRCLAFLPTYLPSTSAHFSQLHVLTTGRVTWKGPLSQGKDHCPRTEESCQSSALFTLLTFLIGPF